MINFERYERKSFPWFKVITATLGLLLFLCASYYLYSSLNPKKELYNDGNSADDAVIHVEVKDPPSVSSDLNIPIEDFQQVSALQGIANEKLVDGGYYLLNNGPFYQVVDTSLENDITINIANYAHSLSEGLYIETKKSANLIDGDRVPYPMCLIYNEKRIFQKKDGGKGAFYMFSEIPCPKQLQQDK